MDGKLCAPKTSSGEGKKEKREREKSRRQTTFVGKKEGGKNNYDFCCMNSFLFLNSFLPLLLL